MNILPMVVGGVGLVAMSSPIIAQQTGVLVNTRPSIQRGVTKSCLPRQKDARGRCPSAAQSSFRRLSVGTAGSGSGSGGGSK